MSAEGVRTHSADVGFQLLIWGWAITGDVSEPAAATAEYRPGRSALLNHPAFDRKARDLNGSMVDLGDGLGWRRCPDHWALPAVTEYRMLLDIAAAGAGRQAINGDTT